MPFFTIFLTLLLIFSSFSHTFADQNVPANTRFNVVLNKLNTDLLGDDSNTTRIDAFNLQALARLYSNDDSQFSKIRFLAKSLEDNIGSIDKWNHIELVAIKKAQENKISQQELIRIKNKKSEAENSLDQELEKDGWKVSSENQSSIPQIETIKNFLQNFNWPSQAVDSKNMLARVRQQLEHIDQTSYDMSILENGNGLHELRRELRWFLMETRVLNGLVRFSSSRTSIESKCPLPSYEGLLKLPVAKSKYSSLPSRSEDEQPCYISQCLFLAAVDEVRVLGDLKDEAELINNIGTTSDKVPDSLQAKANAIYQEMKSNNYIQALIEEFNACEKN